MQKKILAVVLALAMVFSIMLPMTIASAADVNWVDVKAEIINGKLIVTAVTDDSFNRVALFYADDTSIKSCIKTASSYTVDAENNRVWTIRLDAADAEQTYVLRGRNAETNKYTAANSEAITVRGAGIFESIVSETLANKVYVTVTTVIDPFDRIAVYTTDGSYVKYTSDYTVDGDSMVWNLKLDYDATVSEYLVMARDTRTGFYNKVETAKFTVAAPVEPIISTDVAELEDGNLLVTVTTVPDLYRVKIAYASDPTGCISYVKSADAVKGEDSWTWSFVIARPEANTEYAIDVAYTNASYARYFTNISVEVEEEEVIPEAPAFFAEAEANKVINGWYTTSNGLVQMYVGDWSYYGAYGLTLVANPYAYPTSAATIAVYAADSDEVFANKTAADFAAVLGEEIISFEAVTVAGQYPGYVAVTATYRNLVFQANGSKYFVNYINGNDGTDLDAVSARAFANIVVCNAAPAPEGNENKVVGNWYTTNDGLVQMYVGDWSYYGAYGLTLVAKQGVVPVSAATIAVYAADSDEVFANKTAADFAAVLGEDVTSFEAVTVAGQYPGYVAVTATYHNLVFQANGSKYFVNFINGNDGTDIELVFKAAVASVIVYEKACDHSDSSWVEVTPATCTEDGVKNLVCNTCGEVVATAAIPATGHTEVSETVAATCTTDGSVTVTCSVCGEVISTEVIPATGHIEVSETVAATCTTDGSVTVTCSVCGEVLSTEVIPATGHEFGEWAMTTVPTVGTEGTMARTCSICGEVETQSIAAIDAPAADAAAGAVTDGWYTTPDGLVQLYFGGEWCYYGSYGLTLVAKPGVIPVSAATIATYTADSDEVFENKTKEDFESTLSTTLVVFEKVTVAGKYTGYIAINEDGSYHNLVFQANGYKYFINVIDAFIEGVDCPTVFDILVANVIVNEPAPVRPDESVWHTIDEAGLYTTQDGLVQLQFAPGWAFYGQYGLTLVAKTGVVPITAATVAIYEADSDEVFENKTKEDFESVLGVTVSTFEKITVAGEYTGYIAIAEDSTMYNLVFQANGSKYFINILNAFIEDVDVPTIFDNLVNTVVVFEA